MLLIFLLTIVSVYVLELSLLGRVLWRRDWRRLRRPWAWALHAAALTGLACFCWGAWVEPYRLTVTHLDVPGRGGAAFRIVHISDLHCDGKGRAEEAAIRAVNQADADLVLFTGDCLNSRNGLPRFQDTLRRMQARCGKLAIRGNNDWLFFADLPLFAGTGFQELRSTSAVLNVRGAPVWIAGLDLDDDRGLEKLLRQAPPAAYRVLLHHSPDLVEQAAGLGGADLYLCGHTHGGQVRLPFYGALITLSRFGKKYEMGRYQVGTTTLYVNRGLGLEGGGAPRARFLCPPEVTVIDVGGKTEG